MLLQNGQATKLDIKALLFSAIFISSIAMADNALYEPTTPQVVTPTYQIKATNSLWEEKEIASNFYNSPYQISLFSPSNGEDEQRLIAQTYTCATSGIGIAAIIGAMSSSITNWHGDDEPNPTRKWINNVTTSPVWDRDDWYLNYIAHPYFGGVFYQSARKSGYRQWDAFIYSFMMSTFYWEYGLEAFAEVPSIQDIVVTPVLGWVYGEWALHSEREIWLNGGTLLGSEILGNTSLFLLDPVDSIGRNINYLFGEDIIKAGTGYLSFQQAPIASSRKTENRVGLNLSYAFGDNSSQAESSISGKKSTLNSYQRHTVDPVDRGIIGISVGGVWLNFDKQRALMDAYGQQISLGLYFTRAFSSRLNYSKIEAKAKLDNHNLIYENYSLDMQYYLNRQSNWRPFISAGVGEMLTDKNRDRKVLQLNAGAGLHYKINNNWALQSGWLHYYSPQSEIHENQLASAIIYRFARGEGNL